MQATVLNGTNAPTLGVDVAGALDATGVHVIRWGNGSEIGLGLIDRTQIRYGEGAQEHADLLARHLTAGADLVSDPDVPRGQVVLVAGEDFTTVDPAARAPGTAAALPAINGVLVGDDAHDPGAGRRSRDHHRPRGPGSWRPAPGGDLQGVI